MSHVIADSDSLIGTTTSERLQVSYLWRICLVAAMGGLLFGYDWVVIGGAKPFYEPYFGITESPLYQGLAMSTALVGCLVGAAISGILTDRYGRKWLLVVSALLFTISAIGTALAADFITFNVARVLGGIGIGIASNLSPLYIAEVSPASLRGRLVSVNQLTIVVGILGAQITNWLIAENVPPNAGTAEILQSWNGQFGWRWMFAAGTPPALAFFTLMFLVPESPRWLIKAGQFGQANQILTRIGGPEYAATAAAEIENTITHQDTGKVTASELWNPRLRHVFSIGIGLAVLQQWCGINVIFNYAQEVFAAAGYGVSGIIQTIILTGTVNLVFTVVAIYTVDSWGRRRLLLFGTATLATVYIILGAGYFLGSQGFHMVLLVIAAIACYAMSLAPVTWVVISEIFPNRIRGAAMSVAVLALWTACTVLTFTFPFLNYYLGAHGTFWLYAAICVAGFIFIQRSLPETKDKTLEQLEAELVRK